METQQRRKGMNHDYRGQKGSSEIRYVQPAINLNWRRMNERHARGMSSRREAYLVNVEQMPPIIEVPTCPGTGMEFGAKYAVRVNGKYYF